MGAETVTYALTGAAQRANTVGLTTVFPGSPLVDQEFFDIMAALQLANANGTFAICDNSLKTVLDANYNLWRIVVGGLHYYLPEELDAAPLTSNNCMAVDSAGRWYLGGDLGPTAQYLGVVRLHPDLTVDTTWGDNGWWFYTGPGWTGTYVQGLAIEKGTGKVLVGAGALGAGIPSNEGACCMRINTNGTTDTSFNGGNPVLWNPTGCNITLGFDVDSQSDGKIVVCGASIRNSDSREVIFATRLNANGSFDTTFGPSGDGHIVTDVGGLDFCAAWGMEIDAANRSFLGGVANKKEATTVFANSAPGNNITLTSLRTGILSGTYITIGSGATAEQVVVQVVTGNTLAVYPALQYPHSAGEPVKWNYNVQVCVRIAGGQLDPTFNGTGYNATLFGISDDGLAITIQSTGKAIVCGGLADSTGNGTIITRYNENGTLDTSFGSSGDGSKRIITPGGSGAQAIARYPNDSFVMGVISGPSDPSPSSVIRCNADGSLDTNFGQGGFFHYPAKPSPWLAANGIAVSPVNGDVCVSGPSTQFESAVNLVWAAGRTNSSGTIQEG